MLGQNTATDLASIEAISVVFAAVLVWLSANLPDRAAYLDHGLTAYAALTRALTVHPRDVVFASSGGALPGNFVGGHIIWEGI